MLTFEEAPKLYLNPSQLERFMRLGYVERDGDGILRFAKDPHIQVIEVELIDY